VMGMTLRVGENGGVSRKLSIENRKWGELAVGVEESGLVATTC